MLSGNSGDSIESKFANLEQANPVNKRPLASH